MNFQLKAALLAWALQGAIAANLRHGHRELGCAVNVMTDITNLFPVGISLTSYDVWQGEFCVVGCGGGGNNPCGTNTWIYGQQSMDCALNEIWFNNNGQGSPCDGVAGNIYMTTDEPYADISQITYSFLNNGGKQSSYQLIIEYNDGSSETVPGTESNNVVDFTLTPIPTPAPTQAPSPFTNYNANWVAIASDTQTYSETATFSYSSTITTETTDSFSTDLTTGAKASFMGVGVSAQVENSWSSSTAQTLSSMSTTTYSTTCAAQSCDGVLYMWQTVGTQANGQSATLESCNFWCLSPEYNEVKCPLGYCGDENCQCCNGAWSTDASANNLCSSTPPPSP